MCILPFYLCCYHHPLTTVAAETAVSDTSSDRSQLNEWSSKVRAGFLGVTNKRTTTIPASIYGVGWRTLVLDFPVFKYDEKRIDPIQGHFQFSHNFPSPCAGNCFQNDGHTAIVCLWYRRDRENPFGASPGELQCCQNTNFLNQCERNHKKNNFARKLSTNNAHFRLKAPPRIVDI